jgi:hypothetical protein
MKRPVRVRAVRRKLSPRCLSCSSVAALPAHEELALRAHQQRGEVVRAPQARELRPQGLFLADAAALLAQQHQGRDGGDRHEPEEETEIAGVVEIEAVESEKVRGLLGQRDLGRQGRPGDAGEEGEGQGRAEAGDEVSRQAGPALMRLPFPLPGHAAPSFPIVRGPGKGPKSSRPRGDFRRRGRSRIRMNGTSDTVPNPDAAGRIAFTIDHGRVSQEGG